MGVNEWEINFNLTFQIRNYLLFRFVLSIQQLQRKLGKIKWNLIKTNIATFQGQQININSCLKCFWTPSSVNGLGKVMEQDIASKVSVNRSGWTGQFCGRTREINSLKTKKSNWNSNCDSLRNRFFLTNRQKKQKLIK